VSKKQGVFAPFDKGGGARCARGISVDMGRALFIRIFNPLLRHGEHSNTYGDWIVPGLAILLARPPLKEMP
jgi:hypothetical protein